ncbi:MAG: hypothetical protein ACXVDZ_06350 [Bacteroidia bacterium]
MSNTSFIYRNIRFYRGAMNVLYKGNYNDRFKHIVNYISGKSVTEICFGDTIIADYCIKNKIGWTGIDINDYFVQNALKMGYRALLADVQKTSDFPKADTCIISGSLYHFYKNPEDILKKMLDCAPVIIISEPVINLSNNKGIIGKLAKGSATVNGKKQQFRYTFDSLTSELNSLSKKLNFKYKIAEQFDKDLIIVITK